MTDIPGTGKLTSPKAAKEAPLVPLSTVNVAELRKPKETINKSQPWYKTVYFFLSLGILISLILYLLSLKYPRLLILIPLGPVTTVISWFIWRLFSDSEKPKKKLK